MANDPRETWCPLNSPKEHGDGMGEDGTPWRTVAGKTLMKLLR
jgi:hypothetical protein